MTSTRPMFMSRRSDCEGRSENSKNELSESNGECFQNMQSAFQLLKVCESDGIRLSLAESGGLSIDGPASVLNPDRLARLRSLKAELMAVLQSAEVDTDPDEEIDCPDPCSCGSLELWQSLAGKWHCLRCEPPTRAQQLRERVLKLGRQQRRRRSQ